MHKYRIAFKTGYVIVVEIFSLRLEKEFNKEVKIRCVFQEYHRE